MDVARSKFDVGRGRQTVETELLVAMHLFLLASCYYIMNAVKYWYIMAYCI